MISQPIFPKTRVMIFVPGIGYDGYGFVDAGKFVSGGVFLNADWADLAD
jgi:hypothetical protein